MPNERRIIERAARRYGIDPAILYGIYGAETNFGRNTNNSSAGAQGPFQFMPGTAASLGIDPHNFRQAAFGAAKYLSQYRSRGVKGMLAAYNAGPAGNPNNPETQAYIPKVLQYSKRWHGGGGGGGGGGQQQYSVQGPQNALLQAGGAAQMPQGSEGLLPLLKALQQPAPVQASSSLPAPAFSAAPAMAGQTPVSNSAPAPKPDVGQLLALVGTQGGDVQHAPAVSLQQGMAPGQTTRGGRVQGGRVVVDPNADRAGVSLNRSVVQFARQVSAISGTPLRIGTGTNHSRLTVDGNVSDHWDGKAADIPATGKRLIRIGQAALIAAGMDPRKARQQTGGLYNVGGHQVIFNTQQGGDHTNHLHISARRR